MTRSRRKQIAWSPQEHGRNVRSFDPKDVKLTIPVFSWQLAFEHPEAFSMKGALIKVVAVTIFVGFLLKRKEIEDRCLALTAYLPIINARFN